MHNTSNLCIFGTTKQEVKKPFHHPASIGFTRMNSGTQNNSLAVLIAQQQKYRLNTIIYVKTENFTVRVKNNDTTKTANIKIFVLQSWHIFTRTRTIAMFYLKCKIVRTCDFFHYLTTINLDTCQRIFVTKVTCTDNVTVCVITVTQPQPVSQPHCHSVCHHCHRALSLSHPHYHSVCKSLSQSHCHIVSESINVKQPVSQSHCHSVCHHCHTATASVTATLSQCVSSLSQSLVTVIPTLSQCV